MNTLIVCILKYVLESMHANELSVRKKFHFNFDTKVLKCVLRVRAYAYAYSS